MTLHELLAAMIEPMPEAASITLPVGWLRAQLEEDGGGLTAEEPIVDLTAEEFAELLGRKPSTIRGWLIAGEIVEAYKLKGREWRIPRAAARRYLDAQRNGGGQTPVAEELPKHRSGHRRGAWRKDYRRAGGE